MSRGKVSPFQMASWIATAVAAFGCAIYAPLPNVGDNEVEHCFSGVRADLSRVRARAAVVLLLLLLLLKRRLRAALLLCSPALSPSLSGPTLHFLLLLLLLLLSCGGFTLLSAMYSLALHQPHYRRHRNRLPRRSEIDHE